MLKELREKKAALATQIKAMAEKANTEKRRFSAEEDANWKTLNDDYDDVVARIDVAERYDAVSRSEEVRLDDSQPGKKPKKSRIDDDDDDEQIEVTDEDRSLALQGWLRSVAGKELKRSHRDACRKLRFNPHAKKLAIPLARKAPETVKEARALSTLNYSAGGALVPTTMMNAFEVALLEFGGMRQSSEILRTSSGEDMPWPTANDTTNKGRLLGESTAVTNTDVTVASMVLRSYKASSDQVLVPSELLTDSMVDVAGMLGAMLAERIARLINEKCTTGTGAAQPFGIVNRAALGKTAASATAITSDELLDLLHSVDPAYRKKPGFGFMLHDNLLLAVRKLKESTTNAYIWQPGLQAGVPDRLLGQQYFINQDMASAMTTGQKTILCGDLKAYKIREVGTLMFKRLVERYADNDQEGFLAFLRFDGNLLNAGTNPVKYLAQA